MKVEVLPDKDQINIRIRLTRLEFVDLRQGEEITLPSMILHKPFKFSVVFDDEKLCGENE